MLAYVSDMWRVRSDRTRPFGQRIQRPADPAAECRGRSASTGADAAIPVRPWQVVRPPAPIGVGIPAKLLLPVEQVDDHVIWRVRHDVLLISLVSTRFVVRSRRGHRAAAHSRRAVPLTLSTPGLTPAAVDWQKSTPDRKVR